MTPEKLKSVFPEHRLSLTYRERPVSGTHGSVNQWLWTVDLHGHIDDDNYDEVVASATSVDLERAVETVALLMLKKKLDTARHLQDAVAERGVELVQLENSIGISARDAEMKLHDFKRDSELWMSELEPEES